MHWLLIHFGDHFVENASNFLNSLTFGNMYAKLSSGATCLSLCPLVLKALPRLCICPGLSEFLLIAYLIHVCTKISHAVE